MSAAGKEQAAERVHDRTKRPSVIHSRRFSRFSGYIWVHSIWMNGLSPISKSPGNFVKIYAIHIYETRKHQPWYIMLPSGARVVGHPPKSLIQTWLFWTSTLLKDSQRFVRSCWNLWGIDILTRIDNTSLVLKPPKIPNPFPSLHKVIVPLSDHIVKVRGNYKSTVPAETALKLLAPHLKWQFLTTWKPSKNPTSIIHVFLSHLNACLPLSKWRRGEEELFSAPESSLNSSRWSSTYVGIGSLFVARCSFVN